MLSVARVTRFEALYSNAIQRPLDDVIRETSPLLPPMRVKVIWLPLRSWMARGREYCGKKNLVPSRSVSSHSPLVYATVEPVNRPGEPVAPNTASQKHVPGEVRT